MATSRAVNVMVPQPRSLWAGLKLPGSMQLVNIPRLRNMWIFGYVTSSIGFFAASAVVDAIEKSLVWLYKRIKLRYSTRAEFVQGDPASEWIAFFLMENNIWKDTSEFRVSSKTSKLVCSVAFETDPEITAVADYVPSYESPQLFRWRGYWIEVQRVQTQTRGPNIPVQWSVFLTVFTRDQSVLSALVEEAHRAYQRTVKPYVTILIPTPGFGGGFFWDLKHKPLRPIESVILPDGALDDLITDTKGFFASESWYHRTGIPYRRGYLLYGPPGTGKSSTIHALAGALKLEIYSLSLSARFVDDGFLLRAIAAVPKRSIVLVEDIDCALPSRGDFDNNESDDEGNGSERDEFGLRRQSGVTLSGLLNMIDGIGSDEGKLFFATTNHIERLDPALLRPGRIDRRLRYKLATQAQARTLFERLFKDGELDGVVSERGKTFDDDVDGMDSGSEEEESRSASPLLEVPVPLPDTSDLSIDPATTMPNSQVDAGMENTTEFVLIDQVKAPAPGDREILGCSIAEKISEPTRPYTPESSQEPTTSDAPDCTPANPPSFADAFDLNTTQTPRNISDDQLKQLAQHFAAAVRDFEFSPAELQGYLLGNRERPIAAAHNMTAWVRRQRAERRQKARAKAERAEWMRAAQAARFQQQHVFHSVETPAPPTVVPTPPPSESSTAASDSSSLLPPLSSESNSTCASD